jgi:adenine deaminase
MQQITAQYVDLFKQTIYPARVSWAHGKIMDIEPVPDASALPFLIPGFVDAHVHIESSMMVPSAFARMAVVHGTVATVSDPHEIANVCGMQGVYFMLDDAARVPFKCYFGAPSCVPATRFETAGATITLADVETLLARPDIWYLTEMMNFPGVLERDPEVMAKIAAARAMGKPVDGHAPGLRGAAAAAYVAAGIRTDHECVSAAEALEKRTLGMHILIREGSAAKNFEALAPLLHDHWAYLMFCSDDKHPDSLALGHINELCARAIAMGVDVFKVLQVACVNPVLHYQLPVGLLRLGDPADMVLVEDLVSFKVQATYINGQCVAENGKSHIPVLPVKPMNHFCAYETSPADFEQVPSSWMIGALDGQLITEKHKRNIELEHQQPLRIAVVNRYRKAKPALAWITGIGLQRGAIASSVAHDSHNIVVVGADTHSMAKAVNLIMQHQGGIVAVDGEENLILPLPIAGLMSAADGQTIASQYIRLDQMAKSMGATVSAPFMTLSFMALLVIPHLKLSDQGLFDVDTFSFVEEPSL